MTKPIWEIKRQEKQSEVEKLINALDRVEGNNARTIVSALHYYKTKPDGMRLEDFVQMRLRLIEEAKNLIKGEQK